MPLCHIRVCTPHSLVKQCGAGLGQAVESTGEGRKQLAQLLLQLKDALMYKKCLGERKAWPK